MFDEVVGKPFGGLVEVLIAKHFLGEGAYGLHLLFGRGHAASLRLCACARRGHPAERRHVAMSLGRGELQHRLEGEAAPAVDCRCVCRVAEFGL
jgi:hypothetical protein